VTALLVTRPAGREDPLTLALEHRGYRVHAVPTVAIEPVAFDAARLARCDWIVLTSAHGVRSLSTVAAQARFAAVGEKTAAVLRARGIDPSHIPEHASGSALAESMPDVAGKRVAVVRASAASDDLPEILRRRGATVDEVTAYRTVEAPESSREALLAALADELLAAVLFASGSAVRGFLRLGGVASWPAITIGPRTSAAARVAGFEVLAEAADQNVEALVEAVVAVIPPEGDESDA
jgi:uroporphyrinogen III methyltransferase/synthase